MTVSSILGTVNTALGGGALPSGYLIAGLSGLNELADNLNNSFDNGTESPWATTHLC